MTMVTVAVGNTKMAKETELAGARARRMVTEHSSQGLRL